MASEGQPSPAAEIAKAAAAVISDEEKLQETCKSDEIEETRLRLENLRTGDPLTVPAQRPVPQDERSLMRTAGPTSGSGARPKIMVRPASPPPLRRNRMRSQSLPSVGESEALALKALQKRVALGPVDIGLPTSGLGHPRDMLERMPLPDSSRMRRKSTDFSMLQNLGSIAEQD